MVIADISHVHIVCGDDFEVPFERSRGGVGETEWLLPQSVCFRLAAPACLAARPRSGCSIALPESQRALVRRSMPMQVILMLDFLVYARPARVFVRIPFFLEVSKPSQTG